MNDKPAAPSSGIAVPPTGDNMCLQEWKGANEPSSFIPSSAEVVPQPERLTMTNDLDFLMQELEIALFNKIGNTWEAGQLARINAFIQRIRAEALAVPPERAQTDRAALIAIVDEQAKDETK